MVKNFDTARVCFFDNRFNLLSSNIAGLFGIIQHRIRVGRVSRLQKTNRRHSSTKLNDPVKILSVIYVESPLGSSSESQERRGPEYLVAAQFSSS